ncbi:MAG: hypothetical protein WDW38_005459 [Sanguina aurantia]
MVYQGDFFKNTITGTGEYRWPNGAHYTGQVSNGKRHGRGRMAFADSLVVYEGEWSQGMRHGQGTLFSNSERTAFYKGSWEGDQKSGLGIMQYANGDAYEGSWKCDVKTGHGVLTWGSTQQQYTGQWKGNKPDGLGTHLWFQAGAVPESPTHALLLMYNRYVGHFRGGKRSGYGILYYATGARYEGGWRGDAKHGEGCFVFENGEVFRGMFVEDRPVLPEGVAMAPSGPNLSMEIDSLLEEEDSPEASRRAVANILACYNSELRMLFDKYCKHPSLMVPEALLQHSFTMVTAQFWELMADSRLITVHTNLHRIDGFLAQARRAPPTLAAYRQEAHAQMQQDLAHDPSLDTPEERKLWSDLLSEHAKGGLHSPTCELLFRQFCEALVRVASARYSHVPGIDRRLHVLINTHLLHLVSKNKPGGSTAPPDPFHTHMSTSTEVAAAIEEVYPQLRTAFLSSAGVQALHKMTPAQADAQLSRSASTPPRCPPPATDLIPTSKTRPESAIRESGAVAGVARSQEGGGTGSLGEDDSPAKGGAAGSSKGRGGRGCDSARSAVSMRPMVVGVLQAAALLCHNYLACNTHDATAPSNYVVIKTREGEDGNSGSGAAPLVQAQEREVADRETEVSHLMDSHLVWPEFLEGACRIAAAAVLLQQQLADGPDSLAKYIAAASQEPTPATAGGETPPPAALVNSLAAEVEAPVAETDLGPIYSAAFIRQRLLVFFGIVIGYSCYYLTRNSLTYTAPMMVADAALGMDITMIGAMTSIFPIAYGMSKFISGVVGAKFSPTVLLAGGLMCTAAVNIAFGFGSTLTWFCFFWALNGMLQERGTYWGMWNIAHNLGGFAAPLIAGGLAKAYGWKWGIDKPEDVGYPPVEPTPQVKAAVSATGAAIAEPEKKKPDIIKELVDKVLKNPYIWGMALTYFFIYVVRQGVTSWFVFYLIKAKGINDAAEAAVRVSGLELGGLVGSLVAGKLSDFLISRGKPGEGNVGKRVQVVMLYTVGIAAALASFQMIPGDIAPLQWLNVFMIGFFLYGPQMLIGLCGAELVGPDSVGASEGFLGWVAYLGAANAGIPLSIIVKDFGWSSYFTTLIVACGLALLLLSPMTNLKSYVQREANKKARKEAKALKGR